MNERRLGDQIREARMLKGYSQAAFGEQLNVCKATVSAWELGKNKIKPEDLSAINKLLGTNIQYPKADSDLEIMSKLKELNISPDLPDYKDKYFKDYEEIVSKIISCINIESSHPQLISQLLFYLLLICTSKAYVECSERKLDSERLGEDDFYEIYGFDYDDYYKYPNWYEVSEYLRDLIYYNNISSNRYDFEPEAIEDINSFNNPLLKGVAIYCYEIICEHKAHYKKHKEDQSFLFFTLAECSVDYRKALQCLIPNQDTEDSIMYELRFAIFNLSNFLNDI